MGSFADIPVEAFRALKECPEEDIHEEDQKTHIELETLFKMLESKDLSILQLHASVEQLEIQLKTQAEYHVDEIKDLSIVQLHANVAQLEIQLKTQSKEHVEELLAKDEEWKEIVLGMAQCLKLLKDQLELENSK